LIAIEVAKKIGTDMIGFTATIALASVSYRARRRYGLPARGNQRRPTGQRQLTPLWQKS